MQCRFAGPKTTQEVSESFLVFIQESYDRTTDSLPLLILFIQIRARCQADAVATEVVLSLKDLSDLDDRFTRVWY